jgi:beta-phosphoglucomutase-like phosphatase (HAD superfamily)
MSRLAALIFDVDGTLAETERHGHRVAFNQTFAEHGLEWSWSEGLYGDLLNIMGGKERLQFFIEHYQPQLHLNDQNVAELVQQLHRNKTKHYLATVQAGRIPLRPGVARLIQAARAAGVQLAVATTTTLENVHALLRQQLHPEAPSWFSVIAAGDVVKAKKPAPDIYLYALKQLKLPAARCIAFEDTEHGLQSALGADLTTVVTVNDYTRTQDFSGAALVLDHLGEPEHPFQVLAGETDHAQYVDIPLLQTLLGEHGGLRQRKTDRN